MTDLNLSHLNLTKIENIQINKCYALISSNSGVFPETLGTIKTSSANKEVAKIVKQFENCMKAAVGKSVDVITALKAENTEKDNLLTNAKEQVSDLQGYLNGNVTALNLASAQISELEGYSSGNRSALKDSNAKVLNLEQELSGANVKLAEFESAKNKDFLDARSYVDSFKDSNTFDAANLIKFSFPKIVDTNQLKDLCADFASALVGEKDPDLDEIYKSVCVSGDSSAEEGTDL